MTEQEIDLFIRRVAENRVDLTIQEEIMKLYFFSGMEKPYTLRLDWENQTNLDENELRQLLAGDLTLNDLNWY